MSGIRMIESVWTILFTVSLVRAGEYCADQAGKKLTWCEYECCESSYGNGACCYTGYEEPGRVQITSMLIGIFVGLVICCCCCCICWYWICKKIRKRKGDVNQTGVLATGVQPNTPINSVSGGRQANNSVMVSYSRPGQVNIQIPDRPRVPPPKDRQRVNTNTQVRTRNLRPAQIIARTGNRSPENSLQRQDRDDITRHSRPTQIAINNHNLSRERPPYVQTWNNCRTQAMLNNSSSEQVGIRMRNHVTEPPPYDPTWNSSVTHGAANNQSAQRATVQIQNQFSEPPPYDQIWNNSVTQAMINFSSEQGATQIRNQLSSPPPYDNIRNSSETFLPNNLPTEPPQYEVST